MESRPLGTYAMPRTPQEEAEMLRHIKSLRLSMRRDAIKSRRGK